MKFGENLRKQRMKAKLTQDELAKKMEVSSKTISRWEKEDVALDEAKMKKLAKVLKCTVSDLMQEKKKTTQKKVTKKIEPRAVTKEEKIVAPIEIKEEKKVESLKNEEKQEKETLSLNKQDSKVAKGLSKTIGIIAKVMQVVLIIGGIGLLLLMIFVPMLFKHVDITNEMIKFSFQKDSLVIRQENNELSVFSNEKKIAQVKVSSDLYNGTALKIFNTTSKKSIVFHLELLLVIGIVDIVLLYLIFKNVYLLMRNIHDDKSPFKLINAIHLQRMAYLLIGSIVVSNVGELVLVHLLNISFDVQINLLQVVFILALFLLSYIFMYGTNLQKSMEGKIYSE